MCPASPDEHAPTQPGPQPAPPEAEQCPRCGTGADRIQYGYPTLPVPDGVVLGGCVRWGYDPAWCCPTCDYVWGSAR